MQWSYVLSQSAQRAVTLELLKEIAGSAQFLPRLRALPEGARGEAANFPAGS
jgi:hypothetical protein